MMARWDREETGMALVMVLLMILTFVAIGAFIMLGVDRNAEMRGSFQKSVAGFQAAEAGINVGAAAVLNTIQANQVPTNCNPQALLLNGRTVTYTLAGCGGNAQWVTLPADDTYAGLGASVLAYTLTSSAVNTQGFTEASLAMRIEARQIPLFQFLAFYQDDLEYLPSPATVLNGRLHTNGDLYLNVGDCGSLPGGGLQILGPVTIVGSGLLGTAPLNRGRKDQITNANQGHVYISLDGTAGNQQILGTDAQGSTNCGPVDLRQITQSEVNTWGGRIRTGVKSITLPSTTNIYCAPWTCPTGQVPPASGYWQNADLRIVLDLTATPQHLLTGYGPALPPVVVVDALGNPDSARTHQLETFMQTVAGAITYNDLPTGSQWDCFQYPTTCESNTYNAGTNGYKGYAPNFPSSTSTCPGAGLSGPRQPRTTITSSNYCYDYRYGGFYNWRERKPILMMNVDWIALEEWNRNNSNALFDPSGTTNHGLVIFLSVHGPNSQGANDYGVRIYDAARARRGSTDQGITFATDGAMYTLGNFNCPQPNTSGGTSSPAVCGPSGDQKPAAIAADTVNVLSCAWIQSGACGNVNMDQDQWPAWSSGNNPYRPLDERSTTGPAWTGWNTGGQPAAETIMDAALVIATDRTWCPGNPGGLNCGANYYGGGLENVPRFHEDWTGQRFWYQGSIVAMGTPNHTCSAVAAQWTPTANDSRFTCSVYPQQGFTMLTRYVPPAREWFYDLSFNNAANLPPLTPRLVSAKQVFFTEPLQ